MTTQERLMSHVNKTDSCWLWIGAKNPEGYGRFNLGGKYVYPHRYSYELVKGEIPQGLFIDHLCRVPACLNPDHLEAVTIRENTVRGDRFTKKKSGLPLGVQRHRKKFRAYKMINSVSKFLGSFETPELAHKAYLEAGEV